jgi:hypothetical protein
MVLLDAAPGEHRFRSGQPAWMEVVHVQTRERKPQRRIERDIRTRLGIIAHIGRLFAAGSGWPTMTTRCRSGVRTAIRG